LFFDDVSEVFIRADAAGVGLSATRVEAPDVVDDWGIDGRGLDGHDEPSDLTLVLRRR
jgi:hypothetical protein